MNEDGGGLIRGLFYAFLIEVIVALFIVWMILL